MDASSGSEEKRPRWVKISAIVVVVLVVILVAAMLLGGEHGPGRHFGGLPAASLMTSIQAAS